MDAAKCLKQPHKWNERYAHKAKGAGSAWALAQSGSRRWAGPDRWSQEVKVPYDIARHMHEVFAGCHRPPTAADTLQRAFSEQVERWKAETRHWSSVTKMIAHPSYLRIIGLNEPVVPLLIRELDERPDHWFAALEAITGENPVPVDATFDQAVTAWVEWWNQRQRNDPRRSGGEIS